MRAIFLGVVAGLFLGGCAVGSNLTTPDGCELGYMPLQQDTDYVYVLPVYRCPQKGA